MRRKILNFLYEVAQWWVTAAFTAVIAGLAVFIIRKPAALLSFLTQYVPALAQYVLALPQWPGTPLIVIAAVATGVVFMRLLFAVGWFYGSLGVILVTGLFLITPDIYECAWPANASAAETLFQCVRRTDLAEKLGGELIVAFILALVVDQYVKRNFAEEVTRDLLSFAAGHFLEDSIRKKISELIRAPYVRRNFLIQFKLEDLGPDFVRVTMTTKYEVKNLAEDRPWYTVRSSIETSRWTAIERPMLREFKLAGSSRWSLAGEKLAQKTRQEGPYLVFQRRRHLEPSSGRALEVSTLRSAVYPRDWYYVLDLLGPSITIGVTVEFDRLAEFEWHVHFGAGDDLMDQSDPTKRVHPGVHLPGQFVRVTWTPRRMGT
jgi:hypothetical protein